MINFFRHNWQRLVLSLFFFLGVWGFLTFEKRWSIIILLLFLIGLALWRVIREQKLDWAIYLVLFLTLESLYGFYLGMNWSLGLIMLGVVVVFVFSYFLFFPKKNILNYLYLALASLIGLELFISLIPWPIEPRGKSLILAGAFFTLISTIQLSLDNHLRAKEIAKAVLIFLGIILLVVFTSRWMAY